MRRWVKRSLLLLLLLGIAVPVGLRVWDENVMSTEEKSYVGKWATKDGWVWEVRPNRVLLSSWTDRDGKEEVREYRWYVKDTCFILSKPDSALPFVTDSNDSRTYTVREKELDGFKSVSESGDHYVYTRQPSP